MKSKEEKLTEALKEYIGEDVGDVDGTVFQVFSAMDDTYTYYFIANLKQSVVIRMQSKNAVAFLSGMEKVN